MQVQEQNCHVYLADFGLSRVMSSTQAMGTRALQAGTPGFQAPEQLKAEEVDEGADVYAFGVTMVELFGEKLVWNGLNHYQILCKVAVEGALPQYDPLPSAVQHICAMCVTKRESRFPISEVLRALLEAGKA